MKEFRREHKQEPLSMCKMQIVNKSRYITIPKSLLANFDTLKGTDVLQL